jgi:hypothetical protein
MHIVAIGGSDAGISAALRDLDLSYTPPLGSPWDAVQAATQAWSRAHQPIGASA